jgi:hypothetical protein
MASEQRSEVCADCGADRDREWLTGIKGKGEPMPKGWRRVEPQPQPLSTWVSIEAPTRWTSLCLCDAP